MLGSKKSESSTRPLAKTFVPDVRRTCIYVRGLSARRRLVIMKIHTIGKLSLFLHFRNDMNSTNHRLIGRFAFTSLIACMLLGCGDVNRAKIIGTWGIDRADTVMSRIDQSDSSSGTDADAKPDPESQPKMLVSFHRNGQLETSTAMGTVHRKKAGRWELVSFNESEKIMTIECEMQMQKTQHEITFVDDDTIKLVPPNMAGTTMKTRFKRQSP